MVKNLQIYSKNKSINKANLHKLISFLINNLDFKIDSLYINFISGNSILEVNREFLHHDYSTDVLTFNYSRPSRLRLAEAGSTKSLDAEILISIEDAETNSAKYGVSFNEEILRLVIHGILHLLGYNDINSEEKLEMKRIEDKLFIQYKNFLLKNR
ncbi:MAG TPA: rRNA maturation RNase YbeY [Ignavibacteriaceae bacterium]|nr:rRNA maturation RNase YbeY [Ignavibacteriaceae bacterium]